ncbi:chaperone protein DnaK [Anopheles funestus]|uniref:UDENN domain-containing protein n=1 Tax=Anopheles funestus TaxID=62324 RepID=A0A182RB36_ANOFN|nr:chaperone protein DnaK [Anopheles funestus]XP_049296810.1 chaperone protein DnaK [Anopheles funestus]XP_049296811.1 chaperone protein DnaK [Anopheles funestus]
MTSPKNNTSSQQPTSTGTATASGPTVALGIDFGTSYSSVGIYRNGKFEIIANECGNHRIPSVVAFTEKGRLVGEEALAQADIDPANCVIEVKRILGRHKKEGALQVQFKGETKCYHPEEICGIILAHLRSMAERQLGVPATCAVIAVPAQFSDGQRQAVLDAATIAGLTVLRLINEPTAAAISIGINKKLIGEQYVLVCSFGGGFLDVSIVTIYNGVFQVKASSGDTRLGGSDIDNRLVEYFVKELQDKQSLDITRDGVAMRKLRKACEQAKRTLSYTSQVTVEIDDLLDGYKLCSTLTKDNVDEQCKDLFERVILHVETALRRARKDRFAVHEIMLVGESSRIPRVQIMLSEFFDRRSLSSSVNSDEAVVVGTAIAAGILSGDKSCAIQDLLWWDLVPRSIGMIGEDIDGAESPRILISRNSTLPLKVRHRVKNFRDTHRLYEGESAIVSDNITLGHLQLEGSFGEELEDVGLSFNVDLNGVLHVMVEGNIELKATLDKGRLERYEIDRIVYEHKRLILEMEHGQEEEEQRKRKEMTGSVIDRQEELEADGIAVGTWDRFSEWLHCVCVVTFDLELGQAMELIYPKHVTLTEQEKMNICYLAFPDSNSGCMGDSQFHIRLRVSSGSENSTLPKGLQEFNCHCMPVHRADPGHFWGFVYFRQIKDATLKRGYFQKSLVLLTRLPFINLFYELCGVIAPSYFSTGEPTLEAVCDSVCKWPSLLADEPLQLHLLGHVYEVGIPKQNGKYSTLVLPVDSLYPANKSSVNGRHNQTRIISSVHEIDIFRSLQLFLPHIHLLWELVLTGEPIIVTGTSPTDCAHMVQSLTSLISPLAYCAESRPYFTIHDTEFKEFTQNKHGHPAIILGVTNPFFAKTLQHWPHTIRLQDSAEAQLQRQRTVTPSTVTSNTTQTSTSGLPSDGSATLSRLSKIKQITHKLLDSSPGLYTQYKPFVQKDKAFIKKILLGLKTDRPLSVQSALLRRHLLELTQSFMIPLERYMASLMPLQKDISPFRSAPQPNPFKQEDFLATLDDCGPQLTSSCKGDWEGLYRRFFSSPNFKGWYDTRYFELEQTLQVLHMQTLSESNLAEWAKGKLEVEIVDMILRLRHKLTLLQGNSSSAMAALPVQLNVRDTRDQLLRHMENMKKSLPEDLKQILGDA